MLTERSSSEDGTGNFASVLRDQGKERKYRKQRAFVGLGRSLVSIVVAIRGP